MAEPARWVNAVIEVVIPLDVPVDASAEEKTKAMEQAMFRAVNITSDVSVAGRWEIAEEGEFRG